MAKGAFDKYVLFDPNVNILVAIDYIYRFIEDRDRPVYGPKVNPADGWAYMFGTNHGIKITELSDVYLVETYSSQGD